MQTGSDRITVTFTTMYDLRMLSVAVVLSQ